MNKKHPNPNIYDPAIPFDQKGILLRKICAAMAAYRNIPEKLMRAELLNRLHVDIDNLNYNETGIFLLYEYLYEQRPDACRKQK